MIRASTLHLRDLVLAEARARGVSLEMHTLTMEVGLPLLRLRLGETVLRSCQIRLPGVPGASPSNPDVITVHGSGYRSSRMWPRKLDGSFNIQAVTDWFLALAQKELSRSKPSLRVPSGVSSAASGLHVIHCAGVYLGTLGADSKAETLLELVEDENVRAGMDAHLGAAGLSDRELRVVGDAAHLFFSRPGKLVFDPFEPLNDKLLTMVVLGETKAHRVERRYALVLDRRGDEVVVADPAGRGLVTATVSDLDEAWQLAARRGRPRVRIIGLL